jgi:hypothetical protein
MKLRDYLTERTFNLSREIKDAFGKTTKETSPLVWQVKEGLEVALLKLRDMGPKRVKYFPGTGQTKPVYMFEFPGNVLVSIYASLGGAIIQQLDYNKFKHHMRG